MSHNEVLRSRPPTSIVDFLCDQVFCRPRKTCGCLVVNDAGWWHRHLLLDSASAEVSVVDAYEFGIESCAAPPSGPAA